jgi:hypothetical protein
VYPALGEKREHRRTPLAAKGSGQRWSLCSSWNLVRPRSTASDLGSDLTEANKLPSVNRSKSADFCWESSCGTERFLLA